jgi:hypothetical protein
MTISTDRFVAEPEKGRSLRIQTNKRVFIGKGEESRGIMIGLNLCKPENYL